MNWAKGIVKVAVGKIDYGDDFPITERYEYVIASFNDQGEQSTLPGTFTCLPSAREHLHVIHSKIVEINRVPCLKGKPIDIKGHLDVNQSQDLENRRQLHFSDRMRKSAQRKYDNLH